MHSGGFQVEGPEREQQAKHCRETQARRRGGEQTEDGAGGAAPRGRAGVTRR